MRKISTSLLVLLLAASTIHAVTPSPADKPATNAPPAVKATNEVAPPPTNSTAVTTPIKITAQPAEKLLPDDTLVMITIPDFNKAREIYQNSPQGKLWNDPAMKDFKDKFVSKFNGDYVAAVERDLGVHFEDFTNLPQGQFTFAIVQNGWQAKENQSSATVFLMDTRDKSSQLQTNLDELKKKWINAGKTMRTQKIRDVDFSVIVLNKDTFSHGPKKPPEPLGPGLPPVMETPEPKDAPKKELFIGQAGTFLVAGTSDKVLEKVIARLSGGSVNVLSDLASFDSCRAMLHDAPVYGWLNSKTLVDIFSHANTTTDDEAAVNPFALQTDKILAAMGLNELRSVAFNARFSNDGSEFNVMLAVPEANRTGLLQILAGEVKDCTPPPFVPADAVKFQRWRLSGQKTWASIRKAIGSISATFVGTLDFMLNSVEAAAKEKDPSFDINKNLFGNLGDDIVTYEKSPRGTTPGDLNSAPSIFLISSPNPEQFANALRNVLMLYAQGASTPTERELLGHKIYTITLPTGPLPHNAPPPAPRVISYTSSGGYVAISSDQTILEEYLRSSETQAKSLRDLPGLADATQKVTGSGTTLFGYSNESDAMRIRFDVIKQNPASFDPLGGLTPIALFLNLPEMKTRDWFDVGLLPPFEKVSKYFYFTVYSGNTTQDSINFKAFAPTPPQLKQ